VCLKPPGAQEDVVITTGAEWLTKWHMGRITLEDACDRGLMEIEGPPSILRDLVRWGGRSAFADVRPATVGSAVRSAGRG
jgi:hypothetical protein